MLNFAVKSLLVSTSLSPVLGTVAVNQFERGKPWTVWIWWLALAIFLAFLCRVVLKVAEKKAQRHVLYVENFERKDQEVLTFLFIYLLPFIQSGDSTLASEWLTSLYVSLIVVIAIAQSGAFHFNPTMRLLFGYRFYAVKTRHAVSNLLISKKNLRRPGKELQTVGLAQDVYLHTGGSHA